MNDDLPKDPFMLVSYLNTLLRDRYPGGLDQLTDDLGLDRKDIEQRLAQAGFTYSAENNRFW